MPVKHETGFGALQTDRGFHSNAIRFPFRKEPSPEILSIVGFCAGKKNRNFFQVILCFL